MHAAQVQFPSFSVAVVVVVVVVVVVMLDSHLRAS